jgi:hypothetical protein
LYGLNFRIFFSHGKPIPQAHNDAVTEAMDWGADWIWLVEEDNKMYRGILNDMLDAGTDVVVGNYYRKKTTMLMAHTFEGIGIYPMGCMLVRRNIFALRKEQGLNYIDNQIEYSKESGINKKIIETPLTDGAKYGGQDVEFSFWLHKNTIPVTVLSKLVGHLELVNWGKSLVNHGSAHEIKCW